MVRARKAFPAEQIDLIGQPLRLLPSFDKGNHRAGTSAERIDLPGDVRPDCSLHRTQIGQRRQDADLLALADFRCDNHAGRRISQIIRRALQGLNRSGKADALQASPAQFVQPRQREHQVRTALGSDQRVHFVHDYGLRGAQHLPAARRGEQQIERFRRSDEDVRRVRQHFLPFIGGGVARAHRHAQLRPGDALVGALQILTDIRRQ